jgi:hypothetical protein
MPERPNIGRSDSCPEVAAYERLMHGAHDAACQLLFDEIRARGGFAPKCHLVPRFRHLLRSRTAEKLDIWLTDAHRCGIYGMWRSAITLRQNIEAIRVAILKP